MKNVSIKLSTAILDGSIKSVVIPVVRTCQELERAVQNVHAFFKSLLLIKHAANTFFSLRPEKFRKNT